MGSGRLSGHEQSRPAPSPLRHSPLPTSPDSLPALDAAFWRTVDDGLAGLAVTLGPSERAGLEAHVRLLFAWNAAINLTALRTAEQVARGHVLDSLAAIAVCRTLLGRGGPQAATLLDLGSGGGFPGLPLALVLGVREAALVDSVGKKAKFLRVATDAVAQAVTDAGGTSPRFQVVAERAEDLADEPEQRERWDIVTARAVGSLAEVAELGLPLARIGGHVVAWKRDAGDAALATEVTDARRVLQAAGGARPRIEKLDADGVAGLTGSVVVVVRKVRPTPDRYPRPPAERRRAALLR